MLAAVGLSVVAVSVDATLLIVCYLVGSIPIANMVAARHGVEDLREIGDRNPGFWNARAQLGAQAWPVFVGDVAKGSAASAVGVVVGGWPLAVAATGAAMVGHAWPIWAEFRGGRSVLVFVGGAIVYSPIAALVGIGALLVVWGTTRRFEWAARVGVFGFPIVQLIVDGPVPTAATGALMTLIGFRFWQADRT